MDCEESYGQSLHNYEGNKPSHNLSIRICGLAYVLHNSHSSFIIFTPMIEY